jgi:hypothetical protein
VQLWWQHSRTLLPLQVNRGGPDKLLFLVNSVPRLGPFVTFWKTEFEL